MDYFSARLANNILLGTGEGESVLQTSKAEFSITCSEVPGYLQLFYVLCKHNNYYSEYIQDSTSHLSELILHPVKRKVAAIQTKSAIPKILWNAEAEQLLPWNAIFSI